jgi:hypothetical protein
MIPPLGSTGGWGPGLKDRKASGNLAPGMQDSFHDVPKPCPKLTDTHWS